MPAASTRTTLLPHLATGLAVSFGLSLAFWLALDVFHPVGFVVWSTVIGLVGGAIGSAWRSLVITVAATVLIRVAHFVVMVHVP